MTRTPVRALTASTVALLAVAATACGAPPEGEAVGASAAAVSTSSYCAMQPVPLTTTEYESVWVRGGPGEASKSNGGTTISVPYCVAATLPPVAPPGGYHAGAAQSCADGTPVSPPPGLELCTAGYSFFAPQKGTVSSLAAGFLCPVNLMTLPASYTASDGTFVGYSWLTPDDGCLGAPIDPTDWAYVEVDTVVPLNPKYPWVQPSNCGGPCLIPL